PSLADRLSIVRIIIAALAVGPDTLSRHQPHRVSELAELSSPVMGTPAGFHPDQARRQLREVLQHLPTRKALAALHRPVLVHAMHLKNRLRNVQPATSNIHLDSPSLRLNG